MAQPTSASTSARYPSARTDVESPAPPGPLAQGREFVWTNADFARVQALIYQRRRFVRILGVTHFVWVPMLAWMLLRLDAIPAGEATFRAWLVALIATNAFSLAIDAWDAARFALGERRPHYVW